MRGFRNKSGEILIAYRGQKEITTTRIIGKKSPITKSKTWKSELERLTIGRLKVDLNQLIPRAPVLARDQVAFTVPHLFFSSLFFYIFFHLLIYIREMCQAQSCVSSMFQAAIMNKWDDDRED